MTSAWWQALIPVHGLTPWWLWLMWSLGLPLQLLLLAGFLLVMRKITRNPAAKCHVAPGSDNERK